MLNSIKDNLKLLSALVIKEFKLKFRYKYKFILSIINPSLGFIIPYLVFRKLFQALGDDSFGIWTPQNYVIFILTGIIVVLIINIISIYGKSFLQEKYWKTLSGIFMSPLNISLFLIAKLVTELLVLGIPLVVVFIVCFIITQASFISILAILGIFFCSCFFIASLGLAIGSFRISIEGNYTVLFTIIQFFLIFSCYKYPRDFFPWYLQFIININPFYYYWDLMRNIFVFGFDFVLFNPNFLIHLIIILSFTTVFPILSIKFFNIVYRKYGITGY